MGRRYEKDIGENIEEDMAIDKEEQEFWEEWVSLEIQKICLIERKKLKRFPTTAELRKLGKEKKDGT